MQDGESIKERTKRNGRTIEQAHIYYTNSTYTVTVIIKQVNQKQIEHSNKQSKASQRTVTNNKSNNAELPDEPDTRQHLRQFYFNRDRRHPQSFTQRPKEKEKEVATSLSASSLLATAPRVPPAWSPSSCLKHRQGRPY